MNLYFAELFDDDVIVGEFPEKCFLPAIDLYIFVY